LVIGLKRISRLVTVGRGVRLVRQWGHALTSLAPDPANRRANPGPYPHWSVSVGEVDGHTPAGQVKQPLGGLVGIDMRCKV